MARRANTFTAIAAATLWSSCVCLTIPRIEADIAARAAAAVSTLPGATVEARGRTVILHGIDASSGDAAFAARRLLGVPGIRHVSVATQETDP